MGLKNKFLNLKLNVKFTIIMVVFIMAPIIILASLLLQGTKASVIDDNMSYMTHNSERVLEQIKIRVDAINMVTQLFLKDEGLLEMLEKAYREEPMETEAIQNFKLSNISSLERLVNNNASLYGVRMYGQNDAVYEMMPILYQHARMKRQEWASKVTSEKWCIGYQDEIFNTYIQKNDTELLSLITPVYNDERNQIATLEAAMKMEEIFPSLYENTDNQWSCLVENNKGIHYGVDAKAGYAEIVDSVLAESNMSDEYEVYYKIAKGYHVIVTCMELPDIDSKLIVIKDVTETIDHFNRQRYGFSLAMVFLTMIMALVINKIVKVLLKKFYNIISGINQVQKGDLNIHFEESGTDEMSELGSQINKMLIQIKNLMNESIQTEVLVKNSEIKALQNQINAHFIYNVLEAIKMMAEIGENYEISDSVTALGELLRYGMRWTNRNVTVREEIEYIKNYIQLMNLRYDFIVQLSINMPEIVYAQEIPKMSLQPIVENAICHGIEELSEDATIYMKAIMEDGYYMIEITDSGKGMNEEQVDILMQKINGEIEVHGGSGNGIGLKNVQDRIQLSFGEQYGIKIVSKQDCFTKIIVALPYITQNKILD